MWTTNWRVYNKIPRFYSCFCGIGVFKDLDRDPTEFLVIMVCEICCKYYGKWSHLTDLIMLLRLIYLSL